jgi:hypothetical protein
MRCTRFHLLSLAHDVLVLFLFLFSQCCVVVTMLWRIEGLVLESIFPKIRIQEFQILQHEPMPNASAHQVGFAHVTQVLNESMGTKLFGTFVPIARQFSHPKTSSPVCKLWTTGTPATLIQFGSLKKKEGE